MASVFNETICDDYLAFEDSLKQMRAMDDKIIYALNSTLPTDSFKSKVDPVEGCRDLHDKLVANYRDRESRVQKCVSLTAEKVRQLKQERDAGADGQVLKRLRQEQNKLRLFQTELGVEEILRDRTLQVYSEKCRAFYKPPATS